MRESKLKVPVYPTLRRRLRKVSVVTLMAQVYPVRLLISQNCSCPDEYEAASCKEGQGDIGKESEAAAKEPSAPHCTPSLFQQGTQSHVSIP